MLGGENVHLHSSTRMNKQVIVPQVARLAGRQQQLSFRGKMKESQVATGWAGHPVGQAGWQPERQINLLGGYLHLHILGP